MIEFDIEHIVPVAKFEKFNDTYPISDFGNLCYLPVKDNRSKRDHTIYEYAMDRPSLTYDEKFLSFIDYPHKEELVFIDTTENKFKGSYTALIEKREHLMIDKFTKLIIQ